MSDSLVNKVLIIDDAADYRQLLITFFKKACPDADIDEYDPTWGKPPETFPWARYDLLILDYDLGADENGLEWLRHNKTSSEFPPTIILTASDDEELVVEAIRYGAQGFLRKEGLTKDKLLDAIKDALKAYQDEIEKASSQKIRVHVYNKEKFFESLEKARINDAVFLLEIDKYQALSETLGIFGSDKLASFISESVSNFITEFKHDGYMTRIADSSVAILIQKNKDIGSCEEIAKNLCEYFNDLEYENDGKKTDYSINIGLVYIDDIKVEISKLLSSIEFACRKARDQSGNSYFLHGSTGTGEKQKDTPKEEKVNDKKEVIAADAVEEAEAVEKEEEKAEEKEAEEEVNPHIKDALKEDRVQPLFQVLVLVSDAAANAETELYQTRANLLDPDKNIIEAKEFIPVFEKTKTLKTFDRWMIRYCIGELAKLNENEDEKFAVFITLSEQSLNDKGLSDWVNKLLEYVKMPKLGSALIFEINAKEFLEHHQAKLQINKLRVKLGASIALADIQNISMLEDCLQQEKFDFVMFSPEHTDDSKMEQEDIEALAMKAKENNSLSVASKIDSGEYLAMAASVGVDYVLGHFVQPPMENIVASETVEVTDR